MVEGQLRSVRLAHDDRAVERQTDHCDDEQPPEDLPGDPDPARHAQRHCAGAYFASKVPAVPPAWPSAVAVACEAVWQLQSTAPVVPAARAVPSLTVLIHGVRTKVFCPAARPTFVASSVIVISPSVAPAAPLMAIEVLEGDQRRRLVGCEPVGLGRGVQAVSAGLILDDDELAEITGGYTRQADQLRVLLARGFYRAAILRGRLVLERSHYDSVTRSQAADASRPRVKPPRVKAAA